MFDATTRPWYSPAWVNSHSPGTSRERFCDQVGQGWFATMRTPTGQSAWRGVGDADLTWGSASVRLRAARWGRPELVRRVSGAAGPAASCGCSRLPPWVFNEGFLRF